MAPPIDARTYGVRPGHSSRPSGDFRGAGKICRITLRTVFMVEAGCCNARPEDEQAVRVEERSRSKTKQMSESRDPGTCSC